MEKQQKKLSKFFQCPFFSSESQRLVHVLTFKDKFEQHSTNQLNRRQQNQTYMHKLYQKQGTLKFNRCNFRLPNESQIASSILCLHKGVIAKNAYNKNIQNDLTLNQNNEQYHYFRQNYDWLSGKDQIKEMVETAARQDKSQKYLLRNFVSHLASLRNILVHNASASSDQEYLSIKRKLEKIGQNYPKFFVFIYQWEKAIGLPFQTKKKKFKGKTLIHYYSKILQNLCMEGEQNIKKIGTIKQLKTYTQFNIKNAFKYKQNQKIKCELCISLSKALQQNDVWKFLQKLALSKQLFKFHNVKQQFCVWNNPKQHYYDVTNIQKTVLHAVKDQKEQYVCWKLKYLTVANYKCSSFFFEFLRMFRNLFEDIRYYRYLWDTKSTQLRMGSEHQRNMNIMQMDE